MIVTKSKKVKDDKKKKEKKVAPPVVSAPVKVPVSSKEILAKAAVSNSPFSLILSLNKISKKKSKDANGKVRYHYEILTTN